MENQYAIIDQKKGWLVNLVLWDGDTEKWQPPEGKIAKLASEIDFSALPEFPEDLTPPDEELEA